MTVRKAWVLIMLILIGTVPTAYALNRAHLTAADSRFSCRLPAGITGDQSSHRPDCTGWRSSHGLDGLHPDPGIQQEYDAGSPLDDQRHRERDFHPQEPGKGSGYAGAQFPQRHVSGERGLAPGSKERSGEFPFTRAEDYFGLPASTTHVLSSGVGGTMAANRSGLQWDTIRNLLLAWALTLRGL